MCNLFLPPRVRSSSSFFNLTFPQCPYYSLSPIVQSATLSPEGVSSVFFIAERTVLPVPDPGSQTLPRSSAPSPPTVQEQ